MSDLESELKRLIVDALKLEDISPDEIDSDEALFGTGLGLDSIDALELGVALRQKFGLQIEKVSDEVRTHFSSVSNLARFIAAQGRA